MARILIADDDDNFRNFLLELVSDEGFIAVGVPSGEAAMATLRALVARGASAEFPDLMMIDYNMTGMNGFELLRAARGLEQFRRLNIMMVTGTDKKIQGAVEMEGVKFLPKWSAPREIIRQVRSFMPAERAAAPKEVKAAPPPTPLKVVQVAAIRNTAPAYFPRTDPHPPPPAPAPAPAPPRAPAPPPNSASAPPPPPAPSIAATPARALTEQERSDDQFQRLLGLSHKIVEKIEPHADKSKTNGTAEESSQIINLVNGILEEAIRHRASDIHLDPQQSGLHVRFRIDGILHSKVKLPAGLSDNIVSRLKIMSDLNVTERRQPQDGRFSLRPTGAEAMEFRLSTLPAHLGEKIVIRLLKTATVQTRLAEIFTSPTDLAHVETALASPNGMILVTGPTGSGKTTTLYSMLDVLNQPTRNIITIEDPIEREVPDITQVAVRASIGYTFEKVIRACLRQDPNIIMVGEIRDQETAEIAMKAAMTGHLVLSTLHSNTAPLAANRLATMGVKPFLIVSSLELIIAQRLLRLLCPDCKTPAKPSASALAQLAEKDRARLSVVYEPKGCDQCHNIGYKGRKVVTEVMPFKSHLIRQLAYECSNPDLIQAQAIAEGMVTIGEGALKLAEEGATSLAEAMTLYGAD